MYMNLKPNKHKRISFNTMTMASLGFIGLPKILGPPLNLASPQIYFLLRSPHLFWSEIFRSPPPKFKGGCYHANSPILHNLGHIYRLSYHDLVILNIFKNIEDNQGMIRKSIDMSIDHLWIFKNIKTFPRQAIVNFAFQYLK